MSTLNPWLTIWTSPRRTIRSIVDTNPEKQEVLLIILGGFAQTISIASLRNAGDRIPLPFIILLAAIGGPIGWFAAITVWGALYEITGSWLGGQGKPSEVRAAIAWAQVPNIWLLTLWVPLLLLIGEEIFTSATPRMDANPILELALVGFGLLGLVVGIWTLIISLKCLGEVHRFSVWKALATMILGGLLIAAPFMGIGLLVVVLMSLF